MKREISAQKLLRVASMQTARVYIKPTVKTLWRASKAQFDAFSTTEVLVVNEDFVYKHETVFDTITNVDQAGVVKVPVLRKVCVRLPKKNFNMNGCYEIQDLLEQGSCMSKAKTFKLEVSEKMFADFDDIKRLT